MNLPIVRQALFVLFIHTYFAMHIIDTVPMHRGKEWIVTPILWDFNLRWLFSLSPPLTVSPISLETKLFISLSLVNVLGGFISWPYNISSGAADTQTCFLFSPFSTAYRLSRWGPPSVTSSSYLLLLRKKDTGFILSLEGFLVLLSNDLRSGRKADSLM